MQNIYLKFFKRRLSVINDFNIFKVLFFIGYVSINLLLLLVINLDVSLFPIILINFLLINYNLSKIALDLNSSTSYTYIYSRKVFIKYMLFLIQKNNPFFSMFFLINFINITLNLMNGLLIINLLLAILIQLTLFLVQLLAKNLYKICISIILVVLLFALLFSKTLLISICLFFLVLPVLLFVYYNLSIRRKIQIFFLKEVRDSDSINFKKPVTYKNMYCRLFVTYLNRISIKDYFEYLFICCLLIIYSNFFSFGFDSTGLLIFLVLVDIELLSDRYFKNLNRTSAELCFFKNSPVGENKAYFLSNYYHKAVIFSMIGFLSQIFSSNKKIEIFFLNFIYLIFVILLITFLYYKLRNKGGVTRKKENNFVIQYILIIFFLVSLIGKAYIIKNL
ncbi:hypothetical protein [Enterococcus hirae]|uniref:hypothetical protein n=1 Tax=Enterococcus hirae TaxID=1354 RepID=UPI001376BFCB|nr:hypothetical protein [Enterococcus hirae]NBA57065.1 hypothetical protein [Enterococcus hirae]